MRARWFLLVGVVALVPALACSGGGDDAGSNGAADVPGQELQAGDYGDQWPFSVDGATVKCLPDSSIIAEVDGETYALNGMAMSKASENGWTNPRSIWRDQPGAQAGVKVPMDAVTEAARALC